VIHDGRMTLPRGADIIGAGDRIVVIGSPRAAQAWGTLLAPGDGSVGHVALFGGGRVGSAIARVLLEQGLEVRLIEASKERARQLAETFPNARVYHASGSESELLQREHIDEAQAGIFALRDDAKNAYLASIAKASGIPFTIAIAHEAISVPAFEQAGIDVSVNPRGVTAEEIVRFAHDPRTKQVAMLDDNRYEVLDVTTRPSSRHIGTAFRDMPVNGALIGAIVRDGTAVFPHGDEVLQAGDRVILFTEAANVPWVVEAL